MRKCLMQSKKRSLLILLTVSLFINYLFVFAADENYPQLALLGMNPEATIAAVGIANRISLDLRNIDVIDALKFLSMKSGLNIIPTQKVAGRVTLRVENVPVKDVFDIMLRSNSLAYDKKGEIYNIMTEQEYRALYGKNFSDTRQVRVLRLKYAIPEQAFSLLDAVKSEIGRLLVEPESGTVLLMDTPERINEAEKTLASLEQKSIIKVFTLRYARAKDIEEQLKNQLDAKKVGTVRADERNNQVIVQTLPDRMKDIEELVVGLDKKTKQVLIDAKIIKIRLSNQLDSGIEWEGLFSLAQQHGLSYIGSYPFSAVQAAADAWRSRAKVLKDMGDSIGSYPFSGTTTSYASGTKAVPGEKLHVGMINNKRDFDVFIKYLQTMGKTKIIANPSLAVINNQEAKIHIGERRAYVTTTTTTGSTTSTVSEEVTYVDVGVQLFITPTINDEGYVIMKIKPEISSVIDNIRTSSNNLIPILDTSSAETTIMAKDGATIILGGMGKEEKTESSEGIPILSKIPLLGVLFRSGTRSTIRTELLIMLTPIIFEGDRLMTAKDKEKELYGIKNPKKFDVFREEVSVTDSMSKGSKSYEEEIPRLEPLRDSKDSSYYVEETIRPIGPKTEDKPKEIISNASIEAPPPIEKEELITKGLKPYGDSNKKQDSEETSFKSLISEKDITATKGFRTYNNLE